MPALSADSPSQAPARILPCEGLIDLVRGVVDAGGAVWIQVTGISMNPVLREGDSVLLSKLSRLPRRGDVLFVDVARSPRLHRVMRRDARLLVTRGDTARTDDAPVPVSACVGHAVAVRRGTVLVALTPTLQFGVRPLLWFVAWWMRVRLPPWMFRGAKPLSRAIGRALS